MSISSTFANAMSGLSVTRKMTEVASNNLANALTDGFGRQQVQVTSRAVMGGGAGANISSVTRAFASEYTIPRRQADADAAASAVLAEAMELIGQALGEVMDPDSLFRRVQDLETALRQFAETPESEPRQMQTVSAAKDLVTFLHRMSAQAITTRQNADAAIAADVTRVNSNLEQIDRLNGQIARLAATDISSPTLIDERERLIDEISAIIPVRVQPQDNDVVHLYTAEGVFLLQDDPFPIGFSARPVITAPMVYDPSGGGALSGITVRGIDISPGSGDRHSIQSGTLFGNFVVRDRAGVDFQARVDRFAADLIGRFQDPAVDLTLAPGDPGLFTDTGATLDPLNIEGLAGRISVNGAADPDQGGSPVALRDGLQAATPGPVTSDIIPRNLLGAMRSTRSAAAIPGLSGSLGAAQMVAGIVELTGIARTEAQTTTSRLSASRQALADGEAGKIGVDQDAELQSLILIEQAFNANVQVIQAASRMLQEITEIR